MSLEKTPRATPPDPLETLREAQNSDGGWSYRKGSSWTEPTVYALLACRASGVDLPRTREAIGWLRASQRPDGGFPPRQSVDQSTWVTALAALLPPALIGEQPHARALEWLVAQSGMESTRGFHLREFIRSGEMPEDADESGWPWFPGTAAW